MASLQKKAIKSIKWTSLKTVLAGLISPITLTVKARFLTPEEFGYIAVILIIISLFRLFESLGISQAIIQKEKISKAEKSSLLGFNLAVSVFFSIALLAAAPLIASFFNLPDLVQLLPIVSVIVLVIGPSLIFRALIQKQLYFKHLSIIEIARSFVTLFSTTFFLVLGFGVTGVVYSQVISALFVTVAVIYVAHRLQLTFIPSAPRFKHIHPFLKFGAFVTGKQLMTFAAMRLDEVLIGYFLTPEILGVYHFGKNMLEKLRSLITSAFGKVLFPLLAKLKHDKQKLSRAYYQISHYIALASFPLFAGISITAHLFVPLIWGEQWVDSIVIFQIFSVAVIFLVLTANVSSSLLYSTNKPGQVFFIDLVSNIIYFISLLLLVEKGMIVIISVYSCYVIYKTIALQYFANKQLTGGFGLYIKKLAKPAFSVFIMVICVLLFQFLTSPTLSSKWIFTSSVCIGAIIYSFSSWHINKSAILELKSIMLKGRDN